MITYLKGKLVSATPSCAVVDNGGIGYKVFIPANVFTALPQLGSGILLHTAHVFRETGQALYGFLASEERDLFEEVIGVSGIGPKTALSLIGHLPIRELEAAVNGADIAAISRVPGIGKKTAQRLVVEMQGCFSKGSKAPLPSEFAIRMKDDPRAAKIQDAINALINLGYNQATAHKAIKKSLESLAESAELPELITNALKNV